MGLPKEIQEKAIYLHLTEGMTKLTKSVEGCEEIRDAVQYYHAMGDLCEEVANMYDSLEDNDGN